MAIRIDGTNTTANPGITGADADTGLQFGTNELKLVTGGTEAVKIDSNQKLTASQGILFGTDTATANTLDDYEEGYFSPTLTAVTPGTLSFTPSAGNGGHYTKIGRTIYFSFNLQGAVSVGTAAGNAFLSGLPFTSTQFSGNTTGGGSGFYAITIPYPAGIDVSSGFTIIGGLVQPNTTLMVFYESNGTSEGFIQIGEFASTINIHGSGTYTRDA